MLSFYYLPDLCAGSFRCNALVKALQQVAPDLHIDLLTTQPNRYRHSKINAPAFERDGNVTIHRFSLPDHDSGMMDQARAFTAYSRQAVRVASGEYDAIFATSSRLMTAALGAFLSRRIKASLYLDIRDLFVDTMNDVFPNWLAKTSGPLIRAVERWTFQSANRINIVSEGFEDYIKRFLPVSDLRYFTNGIDEEFMNMTIEKELHSVPDIPLIVYAGNIGEGQGLHRVIPQAARKMIGSANFRIIGHGGRMSLLEKALVGVDNVELIQPVPRGELHKHYAEADILFLHLNDYPAFKKVLPSKVFEYAATGRPIVAGVAGYSARFIEQNVPNAAVFSPCDVAGMIAAINAIKTTPRSSDRTEFLNKYNRRNITEAMARDILSFCTNAS